MIEIEIGNAQKQPGEVFQYRYEGTPEIQGLVFTRPLALHAEYYATGDGIRLKGGLQATVLASCVRCLNDVAYAVDEAFEELFLEQGSKGSEDGYTFENQALSLDKLVYDAVLLALPQQLLCKEDCLGLCPQCGTDLNQGKCGCNGDRTDDENNPFIKLKEFF